MAKQKTAILTGRNIYYDKHNRAIYFEKKTKIGYIIPKDLENSFSQMQYRYILGVVAFVFTEFLFLHNVFISIPIGVALAILLEYRFRSMLKNLTQIQNFVPEKANATSDDKIAELDKPSIWLRFILYVVLSVLLIVNLFTTKGLIDNIPIVIASIVVSIGALYMACRYLIANFKK